MKDPRTLATRGATESRRDLEERTSTALPHLAPAELADVTRIVDLLARTFIPEGIYVFGSQARSEPTRHSDVDMLVVVQDAGEYPHHLAQQAYHAVGAHLLPLDIMFMTRGEFERRANVVTSLPATVLREGKVLYAAAAP